jgi:hypothetical protein
MRIAALHQLSRTAVHDTEPAPVIDAESELVVARVVRCECRACGAHSNAIPSPGVGAGCPNCGAARLVPVEGAALILPVRRAGR